MFKKRDRRLEGYNTAGHMIQRLGVEEARRQHTENHAPDEDEYDRGFEQRLDDEDKRLGLVRD